GRRRRFSLSRRRGWPSRSPPPATPRPGSHTLSLHDALPICEAWAICTGNPRKRSVNVRVCWRANSVVGTTTATCLPTTLLARQRSEEHTSELQSRGHLVCRLLLEKKNGMPPAARRAHVDHAG